MAEVLRSLKAQRNTYTRSENRWCLNLFQRIISFGVCLQEVTWPNQDSTLGQILGDISTQLGFISFLDNRPKCISLWDNGSAFINSRGYLDVLIRVCFWNSVLEWNRLKQEPKLEFLVDFEGNFSTKMHGQLWWFFPTFRLIWGNLATWVDPTIILPKSSAKSEGNILVIFVN